MSILRIFVMIMRRSILALLSFYRFFLSPLKMGNTCRFHPSCSLYAIYAIEQHGIMRGGWMAIKRLLRCHPYSASFGEDPVPPPAQSDTHPKTTRDCYTL